MPAAFLPALLLGALPTCGPLDLDDAIAFARERSDELAIKQSEVAAARADQALAFALRIVPSATATVLVGPSPEAHGDVVNFEGNTNRSFKDLRPFGRIDVNVVQPLYTWGRLSGASNAADAGLDARLELVEDTAAQVEQRVVALYWATALARRLLALADEVDKALEEAEKKVAESLEKADGEVSPSDRNRLAVFRSVVRARTAEAQRAMDQARIGLAATMALPQSRLALKEEVLPVAEGTEPNAAALLAQAERQRHDLRALDDAIEARRALVKVEEGARLPQFFVAGTFAYSYAPNRDIQLSPWVSDFFNTLNLGFVFGARQDLSFPMLSARVEKARAEEATLTRQREGLLRLVGVQVDGAVADLRAARTRLVATRTGQAAGRTLFRSVQLEFASGLTEAKTLIESYALYVESQIAALTAAYDTIVARARLAQVAGEPARKERPRCELPSS
ncbi:MAG TPA: TolC family protein [Anaeromyxobacteraceae bacterium]|nr:TolC family protein [Anaeromyxobacteraceae bacterium]